MKWPRCYQIFSSLKNHDLLLFQVFGPIIQPFYFSILRDPVDLLVSFWDYYNVKRKLKGSWTIEKFANWTKKPDYLEFGGANLRDTILFDFGMSINEFGNVESVRKKIAQVEKQFGFVMLVEKFRESMVLLKHHLCWTYEDMAGLRLNAQKNSSKSKPSDGAKAALKDWLNGSYIFYDHFKVRL